MLPRLSQVGPKAVHGSRRNDFIEVESILDVSPLAENKDVGPFVTRYIDLSEEATGHVQWSFDPAMVLAAPLPVFTHCWVIQVALEDHSLPMAQRYLVLPDKRVCQPICGPQQGCYLVAGPFALPDGRGHLTPYAGNLLLGGNIYFTAIEGSPQDNRPGLLHLDFLPLRSPPDVNAYAPKFCNAFTK